VRGVYADSVPTAPTPRRASAFAESASSRCCSIFLNRGHTSSHTRVVIKLPTWIASTSTRVAAELTTNDSESDIRLSINGHALLTDGRRADSERTGTEELSRFNYFDYFEKTFEKTFDDHIVAMEVI